MLLSKITVQSVVSLATLANASPTQLVTPKRDAVTGCLEIGNYFKLINTALFSVNYVLNSPHPCDLDLIPVFEARGLDGILALELICLYDNGVDIFGNNSLTSVNNDMIVALIGLFDAAIDDRSPSRNLSCLNLDTDVLNQVGLPGSRIKDIICGSGPCTGTDQGNTTSSVVSATSMASTLSVAPSTTSSSSAPSVSSSINSISSSTMNGVSSSASPSSSYASSSAIVASSSPSMSRVSASSSTGCRSTSSAPASRMTSSVISPAESTSSADGYYRK